VADRVVGIDFGTSTTLIGDRARAGRPRPIPIGADTAWLPSVIGVNDAGNLVVGEEALALRANRMLRSIKSRITLGETTVDVAGHSVDVRTGVLALLREARDRANRIEPRLMTDAKVFLGCPALWTGTERRILADVAQEVGFDVDVADVIDEPVAAGLAWVHDRWATAAERPSGQVLVFDAGGGTLDVALLDVKGRETPEITVLSAEGVSQSGDAVDALIRTALQPAIKDLDEYELAFSLLGLRSTTIKERLSEDESTVLALGGDYRTQLSYTRAELEAVFEPQLNSAARLVGSVVRGRRLRELFPPSPSEIRQQEWRDASTDVRHVVLAGGLSRVPVIAARLQELFPDASIERLDAPQEAIVRGLAMGDELFRLNLPRPAFNFCVTYRGPGNQPLPNHVTDWAKENRVLYPAYSPLYAWWHVASGQTHLGFKVELPWPPNFKGTLEATIFCEAPNRERTRFAFRVGNRTAPGISVFHEHRQPARFSLSTNGMLSLSGSRHEQVRARIKEWPAIRGSNHDYTREIELLETDQLIASQLRHDDWRFQ
jgi:hypothetical protein